MAGTARPGADPFGPAEFQAATGVSRETMAALGVYAGLLEKWQARINLIGDSTRTEVWRRHFYDSAQLAPLIPDGAQTLADIGSGAGFPGLVLALMGVAPVVHLIESDRRKAVFLETVSRETSVPVTVHPRRAEAITGLKADIVTARAVAPLARLLAISAPIRTPATVCLFMKGRTGASELTEAREQWKMDADRIPSATAPDAMIFRLSNIKGPDLPA